MTDQGSTTDDLSALAEQLFALDSHLLETLRQRAELSLSMAQARRSRELPVYTREGQEAILSRLEQEASSTGNRLTRDAVRAVFREILSACAVLDAPLRVGYLGPPGTFSHLAARSAFGLGASYVEHPNIAQVFASVERGQLDFGVAPIENSTEGGVTFTLDCLLTSDVRIRSEFPLDVSLYLLGKCRDLSKIERVYSHPQPLGQCRAWLAAHLPHAQLVSTSSTTAAAREAVTDEASVAVGSHLAAELYALEVLASSIQDVSVNVTRFIVLAKTDAPPTGRDKTSIVFSTADERGALLRSLTVLYSAGLNLSRIESRPLREKLWEYVFFTDLDGHRTDPAVSHALSELAGVSRMVKVLGSYPRHE